MEKTTITISKETWNRLNIIRKGPNETFDDVINNILNEGGVKNAKLVKKNLQEKKK